MAGTDFRAVAALEVVKVQRALLSRLLAACCSAFVTPKSVAEPGSLFGTGTSSVAYRPSEALVEDVLASRTDGRRETR